MHATFQGGGLVASLYLLIVSLQWSLPHTPPKLVCMNYSKVLAVCIHSAIAFYRDKVSLYGHSWSKTQRDPHTSAPFPTTWITSHHIQPGSLTVMANYHISLLVLST